MDKINVPVEKYQTLLFFALEMLAVLKRHEASDKCTEGYSFCIGDFEEWLAKQTEVEE